MSKDSEIYIVMGHGYEDVVSFEKRTILPEGYTVITFCECGEYTTLSRVCPLYPLFTDHSVETKHKLIDPEEFKRDYPEYTMRIYKPGSYIPKIKTTLKMVWNKFYKEPKVPTKGISEGETEEEHTAVKYICKSGVYKYPVDNEHLFDKDKDDMCNHSGWCSEVPESDNVKDYILKSKQGSLSMRFSPYGYTLDDIMKTFGPGVYYLPICRTATCEDDVMGEKIQLTRQQSRTQQEKQERGILDNSFIVKSFPLRPIDRSRIQGRINVLQNLKEKNMLNDELLVELEQLQRQIIEDDNLEKIRTIQQKGKGNKKSNKKSKRIKKNNKNNKTMKKRRNKTRKNKKKKKNKKNKK